MNLSRVSGAGMPDVLEQLKKLGLSEVTAGMAIPYMWFSPGSSEPYSPVVIMIVRGVQNGLRTLGVQTRGDGFIDSATSRALTRISGAHWKAKAWVQIYGDIIDTIAGRAPLGPEEQDMTYSTSLQNYDYYGAGHYEGQYGSLGATFSPGEGSSFVTRKGICVPLKGPPDDVTINLRAHKALQRQTNRVLSKVGGALIAEDGDIGPLTVAAVQAAFIASGKSAPPASCQQIATLIAGITPDLQSIADSAGAVAKPSGIPRGGRERMIDPVTGEETHVSAFGPAGAPPMWLLAIMGIGAAIFWKKTQKKKRKPAKRRRGRRLPRSRTTVTRY